MLKVTRCSWWDVKSQEITIIVDCFDLVVFAVDFVVSRTVGQQFTWGLVTCVATWCSLVTVCDSAWSDLVLWMGGKNSGTNYLIILILTHCDYEVMVSFRLKVEVFFVFYLLSTVTEWCQRINTKCRQCRWCFSVICVPTLTLLSYVPAQGLH